MNENQHRTTDRYQELIDRTDPKRLIAKTRESVIGHEGSLEDFITALSFEIDRCAMLARGADPRDILQPSGILVMGSTGTGKTHSIKSVADAAGLKLFSFDVSSMTGEGWHGMSMSTCLSEVADYQKTHPGEICMVLFDEFDKAVRPDSSEAESSSPARSFLKVLEGGKLTFECDGNAGKTAKTVDLDLVVNILGGAFMGIDRFVAKRLNFKSEGSSVGFGVSSSEKSVSELRDLASIEDVENWGIMSELCGRIGSIVNFDALSVDNLVEIAMTQYVPKFNNMLANGFTLALTNEAARFAAKKAFVEGAGARGMLRQLRPLMMEAWKRAKEDQHIVQATVTTVGGEFKIEYRYGDRPSAPQPALVDTRFVQNGERIKGLVYSMLNFSYDGRENYPIEFGWLADLVDADALNKIVQNGATDALADVLLKGTEWGGQAHAAAKEVLQACMGYNAVFYGDESQYRNLGYVLMFMNLVSCEDKNQTMSPLDIVMYGTVKENEFQGFSEWLDEKSKADSPSIAKWQFAAGSVALQSYDRFSERSRTVQELAAETALTRVALATIDEEEHDALKRDLCELRKI